MKNLAKAIAAALIALSVTLCACSKAQQVSFDVSKGADKFEVPRRITVVNTRTDTVIWQMTGFFSTQHSNGDLDVIACVGPEKYIKSYFDLNEWTTYVVEDLGYEDVPEYYYKFVFLPDPKDAQGQWSPKEAA